MKGREEIALDLAEVRKSIKADVRKLSELNQARTFLAIFFNWTCIAVAVSVSVKFNYWFVYLVAAEIIAARQHGLVILMHEGVHFRLARNEILNDFLSDWLNAYPVLMKTSVYRRHHLLHHRHLNTKDDPDWARKSILPEWNFPMSKMTFRKHYIKYLWGFGIVETLRLCHYLSGINRKHFNEAGAKEFTHQIVFYAVGAGAFSYFKAWHLVFWYWMVPAFLIFPFLMKLRSIAEHFGLSHTHELNETRNVKASWLERFFIVPLNASYHLDHHLFPTIPFYNLGKLNKLLSTRDVYRINAHQNSSYIFSTTSLIHDIIKDGTKNNLNAGQDSEPPIKQAA